MPRQTVMVLVKRIERNLVIARTATLSSPAMATSTTPDIQKAKSSITSSMVIVAINTVCLEPMVEPAMSTDLFLEKTQATTATVDAGSRMEAVATTIMVIQTEVTVIEETPVVEETQVAKAMIATTIPAEAMRAIAALAAVRITKMKETWAVRIMEDQLEVEDIRTSGTELRTCLS